MAQRTSGLRVYMQENMKAAKKVEAKVVQGPVTRRPTFREIGNIAVKPSQLKKNVTAPLKTAKSLPVRSGQENEPQQVSNTANQVTKKQQSKQTLQKQTPKPDKQEVECMEVDQQSLGFSSQLLDVNDIDSADSSNPQLVSDYVNDIYKYLWHLEDSRPVKPRYLDGQSITGRMRTILIDWLVQVHARFTLLQETLYLTVAILDRYLQVERTTPKDKLQLVGITAMFIASKYEEIYCPEIGDFVFITDKTYSTHEIRSMEVKMLKTLHFTINFPLPLHFLRRNSKAAQVDAMEHTLAKYLMELCLPDYGMIQFKASVLAAASLCLSLKLLDEEQAWTATLVFYSNYTEQQLFPAMYKIASLILKSSTAKQQAVFQKYKNNKFMKISTIPELKSKLVQQFAAMATVSS